ncbi:hypothetical protein QQ045_013363 [Rhodiola kirilowii]
MPARRRSLPLVAGCRHTSPSAISCTTWLLSRLYSINSPSAYFSITNAQNDGMTLSTIERFEIPSFDEYDRDNMENFDNDDEEGYVEVPICSEGVNSSLWDFPPFNDVSSLMSHPTIKDHDSNNSQFNTKMLKEGGKDKFKWELRALKKKNEGMWRITKYEGDHTCEVDIIPHDIDIIPHDNVHFNKHFIGMDIRDLIQEKLRFSPYEAYIDMLKESNPGSIVHWDTLMLKSGKAYRHNASDERGGLVSTKSLSSVCLRHFVSNLNQKAKYLAHKDLLYNIAEENQQIKFCNRFKDLKELFNDKPDVVMWLDKVNPETWALAYDTNNRRWGSMTTNQSESFNYVLMAFRDLPITAIVHFTLKQANSWFIKRRDEMLDHNNHHVPKIESIINENIEKAGCNEVQMYDRAKGKHYKRVKGEDNQQNEDVTKWIKGVTQDPKTCNQLVHTHRMWGCRRVGSPLDFITKWS